MLRSGNLCRCHAAAVNYAGQRVNSFAILRGEMSTRVDHVTTEVRINTVHATSVETQARVILPYV